MPMNNSNNMTQNMNNLTPLYNNSHNNNRITNASDNDSLDIEILKVNLPKHIQRNSIIPQQKRQQYVSLQ